MKTTQRSSRRRARLALLAGAVLTAALAVAAALFFRAGDPPPDATNAIQEAPVSAENGNETNHAAGAPSGEPQHELVQGADAEKVKTWIDSLNQAEAQYELAQDPDEIARLQRLGQELKQEWASFDPNTRIAIHLEILYGNAGRPSNPKIHELIEYELRQLIEKGADLEEIVDNISSSFRIYPRRSAEELDNIYQHMLNEKQGIVETHGWKYDPNFTEKQNRISKYFFEHTEGGYIPHGEKTPRAVIEILVEGMDDLTAAKYLLNQPHIFPEAKGEYWSEKENEYAAEYADRVLAGDPSSRDALIIKMGARVDVLESARLLIEHHPTDDYAVMTASGELSEKYPEEAVAALLRILPEDGPHMDSSTHMILGEAYERLDMLFEAAEQYQMAFAIGRVGGDNRFSILERGERSYPSIWEERAAAAAAEAAKQAPQPAEASAPHSPPDAPASPDAPRGMEPPPPNLEAEMSAVYADFAKAYQSAFKMEYALSEATPEGYMNALLGMARAFARAGDAQHAQDAYNAVRKRHSLEEVEQAFRRFDEQERLKRQPPSDEENDDDSGEDE